jgi:peptidoglycan/LPS O-acetylase OafA/YrhL
MRLVAALWIFLYHWRETLESLTRGWPEGLSRLSAQLLEQGYVAVSALFVLSGFVLAYNYPRPFPRGELSRFYVARFARVYPGHLLAFAIGAPLFLSRAVRGLPIPTPGEFASYLTLTSAWMPSKVFSVQEPGWATSAVAFFYLAYPVMIAMLARRSARALLGRAALAWVAALVVPAVFVALRIHDVDESPAALLVRYDPFLRLGEFTLGIAVALWWMRERPALPAYVAPLALLSWVALSFAPVPRMLLHNGALAPVVVLLLVALAGGRGALPRVLAWRPLALLGQAGFGIFILQVPMFWVVDVVQNLLGTERRTGLSFVATLALTLVAASLSLRWLERPAQRAIKAAFDRARSGRRVAGVTPGVTLLAEVSSRVGAEPGSQGGEDSRAASVVDGVAHPYRKRGSVERDG